MNQHRFSRRDWLQSTSLLGLAAVGAPAAGPQGGAFTPPPPVSSGKRLEFNLNVSALGCLTAEMQDAQGKALPGHSLAESPPSTRNRLAAAARWSSGENAGPLAGTPVRVHLAMRSCKLYSFQFTG